ncbi:unnamed protein product [Rhizophagus irregularis]|nr:unnamed protein product [Rhizophagus irregularis]
MKIHNYDDIIVKWIPHNQFNNIKEISKDDSVTLYSALWPNNKNVTLKCIHNSQNITDEFLNEVKSYPIVNYENNKIYGISQDPDTKDYIIVLQSNYCEICGEIYTSIHGEWCESCQINNLKQNFVNWSSENKKIDESIQSMQMNIKSCQDLIVEWVPYNQFDDIKEINKDDSSTLYSALWMNGPLEYEYDKKEYERVPNKKVALKCLHNSQENINGFLKEVKSYIIDINKCEIIYGISHNPNTSDYIIVLRDDYCESCGVIYSKIDCKWCKPCQINNLKQNFTNRTSENEKIDELIQEMQMKINKPRDIIVEWIQYDQFNDIKEINKNDSAIIFTAIWIDGPLEYSYEKEHYERTSNNHEVILKCLLSSRNITNEFLNEVKSYTITINKYENNILLIYGISQNPDTKDYIIVLQNSYCKSCGNVCVYNWCQSCQINNLKQNFTNWTSGNEQVDELIQEMQMKIKTSNDLIVEWILYNQFSDIKEISKNDSTILYSAIWKDGSLNYDYEKEYERTPNYEVTLKCLLGSHDVTNEFLNEVKSYFIKADEKNVPKVYGISQNPDTKDYIIVFSDDFCGNCGEIYANMRKRWCKLCHKNYLKQNFANCTSGNEKIDNFIQEMQSKISNYDD